MSRCWNPCLSERSTDAMMSGSWLCENAVAMFGMPYFIDVRPADFAGVFPYTLGSSPAPEIGTTAGASAGHCGHAAKAIACLPLWPPHGRNEKGRPKRRAAPQRPTMPVVERQIRKCTRTATPIRLAAPMPNVVSSKCNLLLVVVMLDRRSRSTGQRMFRDASRLAIPCQFVALRCRSSRAGAQRNAASLAVTVRVRTDRHGLNGHNVLCADVLSLVQRLSKLTAHVLAAPSGSTGSTVCPLGSCGVMSARSALPHRSAREQNHRAGNERRARPG
jgi:hypothetical protein